MDFLEKKPSAIHGHGIFAGRKILRGEDFYVIPMTEVHSRPRAGCAYVGRGRYVSDSNVLNWVNHSCNPNARISIMGERPALEAVRDIIRGEEVTVNYNKTEFNGSGRVKCNCRDMVCRGWFIISEPGAPEPKARTKV